MFEHCWEEAKHHEYDENIMIHNINAVFSMKPPLMAALLSPMSMRNANAEIGKGHMSRPDPWRRGAAAQPHLARLEVLVAAGAVGLAALGQPGRLHGVTGSRAVRAGRVSRLAVDGLAPPAEQGRLGGGGGRSGVLGQHCQRRQQLQRSHCNPHLHCGVAPEVPHVQL